MTFGRIQNKLIVPVVPVVQQTCKRCCGARRVREGGNFIICRVCAGTGKVVADAAERAFLMRYRSGSAP
jgi:DnaJ-class molecular chaperone